MSIGAGIVWSTVIVLIAVLIWRTTVNRKWKIVGKVVLGLFACGLIAWAWAQAAEATPV